MGLGGRGGLQKGPLPKICHTNPTKMKLETVIPYLKKTQKIYEPQTHHLISADISIFFIRNQQIQIQTAFWYKISNSFDFFQSLNIFLINSYNFDDVSKIGYSRPSKNRDILKWKLWCHNSWLWHHQKNFIMWFKLYCRCGHVSKVW